MDGLCRHVTADGESAVGPGKGHHPAAHCDRVDIRHIDDKQSGRVDVPNPVDGGDRRRGIVSRLRFAVIALQRDVETSHGGRDVLEPGDAKGSFGPRLQISLDRPRPEEGCRHRDEEEDHHGPGSEGKPGDDLIFLTRWSERGWAISRPISRGPAPIRIQLLESLCRRSRHRTCLRAYCFRYRQSRRADIPLIDRTIGCRVEVPAWARTNR